jgi:hypothetical protein
MFKLPRYILIVAAVVAAAGAPSSAYAMYISGTGGLVPASAASVSANPTSSQKDQLGSGRQGRGGEAWGCVRVTCALTNPETSGTRGRLAGPAAGAGSGARHGISSSSGFQWGDAGIGAAVVLVLLSVGSGATVVIRRRLHHQLAS